MSEVSVFVPSYNHAPYIERTLKSIFDQSLKPSRLLVIDDGSTDGSEAVIRKALIDCPFESELIIRENMGLCRTLNEGFALCREPFFAYIGSDDIWLPEFLEKSLGLLKRHPAACLSFGNAYLIDKDDFIIDKTENWVDFQNTSPRDQLMRGKIFPSAGVVYRREHMSQRPWNEDSSLEDYDLYLRLSEDHDFAFLDKILCAWRQHGTNTSGNLPLMIPEFLKAHEKAFNRPEIAGEEYRRLNKRIRFDLAFNFVRHGFRKEALNMMVRNLDGAGSVLRVFDLLFRISIPGILFEWNRERKRNKARKKYGRLEELILRK